MNRPIYVEIGVAAGTCPAYPVMRVASVLVAVCLPPPALAARVGDEIMNAINTAKANLAGIIQESWVSLVVLSMLAGLMAAVVVPVHVH